MAKGRKPDLTDMVDELGALRTRKDQLEARERELRDLLADSGQTEIVGKLYRAKVSRYDMRKIDYRGLVEKLAPSARMIRRFTKVLADQVRVTTKPLPPVERAA